jgi:hypothetical protein
MINSKNILSDGVHPAEAGYESGRKAWSRSLGNFFGLLKNMEPVGEQSVRLSCRLKNED